MKQVLPFLFSVMAASLFAATQTIDGIAWTYSVSDGAATIESIPNESTGDITIPSSLGGYPVTSIGYSAFSWCNSLTSVVIPEGVTSIENFAFDECSALTSVVFPKSLTSIGSYAFRDCSSLTSVVIPEGVTSIGNSAFSGCSSLTSVVFPEGVTTIEDHAFRGCSSLTSVEIPEGVTMIEWATFSGCSALTSVVIPESVTTIGTGAFEDCSALTSVVFPESLTAIGNSAFEGCSSLASVVIPEGVTSIGEKVFYGCNSLASVVFPESVTSIGEKVFYGCNSLASVVFPESLTAIGSSAFEGCSSLASVVIPEGVTAIGNSAFEGCSSLASVVFPESLTAIGSDAFRDCSSLTSVVIPEGVTSIVHTTFFGCSSLTSLQLQGPPPEGASGLAQYQDAIIYFPQKYGAAWEQVLEKAHKTRFTVADVLVINRAKVDVRAEMTTPKTMKVSYTVTSDLPSVKVRAVAFKDGVRSFANIVPVRTGEGVPKGDSVKTNVEHTFVWDVASDWDTDLDKVAVEILVQGETLLPQEQITIPATETHKAMTITRNVLKEPWLFNALVWCVAEGDERLQVQYGSVVVDGVIVIAKKDKLPTDEFWMDNGSHPTWKKEATALLNYLYGKMGYKVLAGEDLAYAERATRLDFADESGKKPLRQVSVKIDEGE